MSYVFRLPGFAGHRMRFAWERQNRLLRLALATSIGLHLAAVAVLPGIDRLIDPLRPPLQVELVRPPTPAPLMQEPPKAQPNRVRPIPKTAPVAPPREATPKPTAPQPKQLLALPEAASSAPSAFTVPQTKVEPTAPPAEEKPAANAAAPPARESIATVPPNFNAAYLRNVPPRYPLMARRNGIEGTVRLKVLVTREGRAAQVDLDKSSGSPALDTAALEAVRNWQFVPARRGQEAIESWVLVPVVFKLEGTS